LRGKNDNIFTIKVKGHDQDFTSSEVTQTELGGLVGYIYPPVANVRGVSGVDSVSRIFTRVAYAGVPYFQMG